MPIYPGRTKDTHRVVVWAHGRSHEKIVRGSKRNARDAEHMMAVEWGARGKNESIAPSFCDFAREQYSPHARQHLGADTWKKVRRFQVATFAAFFGRTRLDALTSEMVDEYKHARTVAGVQPSTLNQELTVLKTMLTWAREDRGLRVASIKIRRLAVTADPRVKCWTTDEVTRIYAVAQRDDPELVPMLVFLINTGCRKGECVAADWSWVDLHKRMLSIPVTRFWRPKNKRPREVPISDALWAVLSSLPRGKILFPSARGRRFAKFPDKRMTAIIKSAKCTGSPHTTRHTFASHFLGSGRSLHELARILGHSQLRTTELYTHLLPGHLEGARNAVNLSPEPWRDHGKHTASA